MSRSSKLITDEVVANAKRHLKGLGVTGKVVMKLRAVIAAKTNTIGAVSVMFGVSRVSITKWIKYVAAGTMDRLVLRAGRGRKCILSLEQKMLIKSWIENNSQITIDQVKLKIESELGIVMSRSGVHLAMKSMNLSYITPRPQHHKQDASKQEVYKKKSNRDDQ